MAMTTQLSRLPYLYRGIVVDNEDPLHIGKCRIHVPDIHGIYDYEKSLLPWARPITTGSIQIPNLQEIVWVFFEGGNKQAPVYLTGVLTTNNPLDENLDIIYQRDNASIYYEKSSHKLILKVGDSYIEISESLISIISESLKLGSDDIGGSIIGGIWKYELVSEVGGST